LGKTSNAAKQKWNSKNYQQVKISIKPETAAAFKAACIAAGTSMASAMSALMLKYAEQEIENQKPTVKVKTLNDRRKTTAIVRDIIAAILDAEEMYVENTPENLCNTARYDMAVERVDKLQELLDSIEEVYDN